MAISSIPFALQNSSHPANLFRQALSSLVPNTAGGVAQTGDLAVTQTGTPSMAVVVGTGRVWIPGTQASSVSGQTYTSQALYYAENDAAVTLSIAAANATNPRIDIVYVNVNDQAYSGTLNGCQLVVGTGTPAPSPVPPSMGNNAYLLATINVAANASSIVTGNIVQTNTPITAPQLTTLPLASGYIPRAANYPTPSVYKAYSRSYLTGSATFNASGTWNAGSQYVIATVPAGFIPAASQDYPLMFRVTTGFIPGFITVDHLGNVTMTPNSTISSSNPTISFEGISWPQP